MKIQIYNTPHKGENEYQNLEPILHELLLTGNKIATEYRWGQDRTGFFCILRFPIDKALVLSNFELPSEVYFSNDGSLWSGMTGCRIRAQI